MTFIRIINLRNILLGLCLILLVLIGFKGYYIAEKIEGYKKAEQFYADKQWIEAEEWYEKINRNRWIHYREQDIANRLQELAPIREIRETLDRIQREAKRAAEQLDFASYKQVVDELQQFRGPYIGQGHPFEKEYREISERLQLSPMIIQNWNTFREHFASQMASNLEEKQYEDESFKQSLIEIPDYIYGGQKKKTALLTEQFKDYDERKLAQLGAAGNTEALLVSTRAMKAEYDALPFDAPWVLQKTDEIVQQLLTKAVEQDQYEVYIALAKRYEQYMSSLGLDTTKVKSSIDSQMRSWIRKGDRLVQAGDYDEAMKIYKSLSAYTDMKEKIKQAELEQAASDPLRLLQQGDSNATYEHVIGGKNGFGGTVYAVGVQFGSRIVLAVWDGKDQVKRYTSESLPSTIQSLKLAPQQIGFTSDVLVAEADSASRNGRFIGFETVGNKLQTLFDLEGDRYEVVSSDHIKLYHPQGNEDVDAVADYRLVGQRFEFLGYEKRIAEIKPEELTQHIGETVRMTVHITAFNDQIAFAEIQEGQYIGLVGLSPQAVGTVTVTGKMNQYTDVQLNDSILVVPVFEVEKVEQ
ncbi:hypothetical protein [Paenibacillus sp. 1001270B_150601_E10]|uniref:hypothetical protein n=1 Tax=Paenibacillus sp. 1001270B_150601_E10 TaxID=2787079 RepID=UPI0018A0D106|nr:hypothetical protein [Paenibacillus sp. 1001270B_150601_E10]